VISEQNAENADALQLRDGAMATIFWLSMGYSFGDYMIASGILFDSWGEFSGQRYPMKM